MTKALLIEKIKTYDSYKDVKDYILNKNKKDELVAILEGLTGVKILPDVKKSSKKKEDVSSISSVTRRKDDVIKLSFGTFKEGVKEKFEGSGVDYLNSENENIKPIWDNILGEGYFEKYAKGKAYNDIMVEVFSKIDQ